VVVVVVVVTLGVGLDVARRMGVGGKVRVRVM